jgi:predicted enzyme related to lactoylglutathione lyase
MSSTEPRGSHVSNGGNVDMHLEIDIIPVSDVDRAKQFYQRVGWRFDDDDTTPEGLRRVQFTPPGSAASITFGGFVRNGQGLTPAAPGSAVGGLTVSDIEAAHDDLVRRGIDVVDIWHGPPLPPEARQPGPDPGRTSYGSFCSFNDPDGNTWIIQEVTARRTLPTAAAQAG